jgi:signal transduction histidine kinase
LKSEKLVKEMKRILQIFPNGVLICPGKSEDIQGEYYTNENFEKDIFEIRRKLSELDTVEVKYKNSEEIANPPKTTTLLHFLMTQQKKLNEENPMVEMEVFINEKPQNSDSRRFEEEVELQKRSYHLMSLMVELNGNKWFMHVFTDTTNILKLEEAKRNIKCHKILFASSSHEFRTPLNAIINSFKFIKDHFSKILVSANKQSLNIFHDSDNSVEVIKKFIKIGQNSSILLLNLIEDILDLSKIEAGTFIVNKSYFNIYEMIEEVKDIFEFQWKQKKIEFKSVVEKDLENTEVFSDRGRLKQILLNLISNSLKFTFSGSIILQVTQSMKNSEEKVMLFRITDTGIGIKETDKPKLFTMFGMISESQEMNRNGTGIGLTVCKKYWEKLGGEIELNSNFGHGTTVTFWLPLIARKIQEEVMEDEENSSDSELIAEEQLDNTIKGQWIKTLNKWINKRQHNL